MYLGGQFFRQKKRNLRKFVVIQLYERSTNILHIFQMFVNIPRIHAVLFRI